MEINEIPNPNNVIDVPEDDNDIPLNLPNGVPDCFNRTVSTYLITGKQGSGKSAITDSVHCSNKPNSKIFYGVFDKVILCQPKETFNSESSKFKDLPSSQVFHTLNASVIIRIKEICLQVKEQGGNTTLICDDMGEFLKMKNPAFQHEFQGLLFRFRHFRCQIWFSAISLMLVPKTWRGAFRTIIMMKPRLQDIDIIQNELVNIDSKAMKKLIEYVFESGGDFNTLTIDTRKGVRNGLFKNFNQLEIKLSD